MLIALTNEQKSMVGNNFFRCWPYRFYWFHYSWESAQPYPKKALKTELRWKDCIMGSWLLTASYGSYHMFLFAFHLLLMHIYFNFIGLFYWLALSRIEPFSPAQPPVELEQFPMQESWISWNIVLYYKTSPKHVQASFYHRGRQDKMNQSYCSIWCIYIVFSLGWKSFSWTTYAANHSTTFTIS